MFKILIFGNNVFMIKGSKNILSAKESIKKLYGQEVDVKVNMGRNKIVSFSGTLSGVYPAIFTIAPLDKTFPVKTSYSYADYLYGVVSVVARKKA